MFSSISRSLAALPRLGALAGRRGCAEMGVAAPEKEGVSAPERVPQNYEKSVNQVILVGRVGAAAQLRGSEKYPVVQFPVATQTHYNTGEGDAVQTVQSTVWHNISVFAPGLRASLLKSLKKGQRVMVQGKVAYFDRKDANGNTLSTVSVVANDVVMFKAPNKLK